MRRLPILVVALLLAPSAEAKPPPPFDSYLKAKTNGLQNRNPELWGNHLRSLVVVAKDKHARWQRDWRRHQQVAAVGGPGPIVPGPQGGVWYLLAQCESGGNWAENAGTIYDGGLQFHPQTWLAYGGAEFAPEAWMATPAQQILVAERVLAGQGWGAWPSCAAKLGLI